MESSRQQRSLSSHIDWLTVLFYLVFVLMGWFNIYSAGYDISKPEPFDFTQKHGKQLIWIAASLIIGIAILMLDERFFYAFAYALYIIVILMLIGVLLFSREVKGAHAWFEIGSFKVQPAEFAKFTVALVLARYLSGYDVKFSDTRVRINAALLIVIPLIIVLLQNDTGSALVFFAFIFPLYREGLPGSILFTGVAAGTLSVLALVVERNIIIGSLVGLAVLLFFFIRRNTRAVLFLLLMLGGSIFLVTSVDYVFENVLQDHQRQRINVLLGKELDLKGAGYNVNQSKIAIGSGGLWGKGFLEGTQTKFNFVPEPDTDFIFCTMAEEHGFVGSLVLVILYIGMLARILHVAERQRSKFNRIYGYSVASILFFHFVINIGMTIGLVPVIGIPLPFFSYGGSSLISFTILLFILLRLDANRVNELKRAFD